MDSDQDNESSISQEMESTDTVPDNLLNRHQKVEYLDSDLDNDHDPCQASGYTDSDHDNEPGGPTKSENQGPDYADELMRSQGLGSIGSDHDGDGIDDDDLFSLPAHAPSDDPLDIKHDLQQLANGGQDMTSPDDPSSSDTRPDASRLTCAQCGLARFEQQDVITSVNRHSHFTVGKRKTEFFMSSCLCCKICGKTFNRKNALLYHSKSHVQSQQFTCHICAEMFAQRKELSLHMETHVIERPYRCDVCGKEFAKVWSKNIHMRVHDGEGPMSCQVCGETFTYSRALVLHARVHDVQQVRRCQECGKTFTEWSKLKLHVKRHFGYKLHECSQCDGTFYTKRERDFHFKSHSKTNPGRDLATTEMGLVAVNSTLSPSQPSADISIAQARSHLPPPMVNVNVVNYRTIMETEGLAMFKCEFCTKLFDTQYARSQHIRTHGLYKPHQCDVCGRGFTQKCNLKTHSYIHTGERRFVCDVCGLGFIQRIGLKRHVKSYHNTDDVASCSVGNV